MYFTDSQVEDLNLPVQRNQELVVKYFCRFREKFCNELLGEGIEKEENRWKIINKVT